MALKKPYFQGKTLACVFIATVLLQLFFIAAHAQTNVSGNQSGTWTLAGSPYIITGDVTIQSGQTLIIQPGVTVEFSDYTVDLFVSGTLKAQGTVSDSILFRGKEINSISTHGGGIFFNTGSDGSILDYVKIDRMGDASSADNAILVSNPAKPSLNNLVITNSEIRDIRAWIGGVEHFSAINASIFIQGGDVTVNSILKPTGPNSFFRFENDITINSGVTLTIQPGVTIEFSDYTVDLFVFGTLDAQGTPANSILFRGKEINSISTHGGGIFFNAGSDGSILDYVKIDRMGDASSADNAILVSNPAKPSLNNLVITNSEIRDIRAWIGGVEHFSTINASIFIQGGNVIANSILKPTGPNSFFRFESDVTINNGVTLTIQPGVTIEFLDYTVDLFVSGTLKAQGTVSDSILFRGKEINSISTHGGGIFFNTGSDGSILDYVKIDRMGDRSSADNAILISSPAKPALRNLLITNSEMRDIQTWIGGAEHFSAINASIFIQGGSVTESSILKPTGPNSFFRLENDITINSGVTLTIQPGVTIEFLDYTVDLFVFGTLDAQGTAGNPILFRGKEINSISTHGGGIFFNTGSDGSILDYVKIDRMGDASSADNAILVSNPAKPSLNNLVITNSEIRDIRAWIGGVEHFSAINASIFIQGGDVTVNSILKPTGPNSFFRFENDITINSGVTLTIQPGVTIEFSDYTVDLFVFGTLDAQGTPANSILFRGKEINSISTHGGGIFFNAGSDGSILDYVKIDRMGDRSSADNAITINANVTVTNSLVENSESGGIFIGADVSPTIEKCLFNNNPIEIRASASSLSNIRNNTDVEVFVTTSSVFGYTTWSNPGNNSRYILDRIVTVGSSDTLIIEPGTIIDLPNLARLNVNGTLKANGTVPKPIRFTSIMNGTFGGTVAFGNTSVHSQLSHVLFDKLGQNTSNEAALELRTADISINNITVANNFKYGILILQASPVITNSFLINNGRTGAAVNIARPVFTNCTISGNTTWGIENFGTTNADTVDARNCWWGSVTGPLHVTTNPTGQGNRVGDKVLYDPWRTQPVINPIDDIGISAILTPVSVCDLVDTQQVKVRINNYGNVTQSGFTVSYRINNGAVVTENVGALSIPALSLTEYTFSAKANLSAVGSYTIKVFTTLPADTLYQNDTLIATVVINPVPVPVFAVIPPVNFGSTPPVLPTTSQNGITGSWSPATVNNTLTTTYTFTPDAGQCATTPTLIIEVVNVPDLAALNFRADATEVGPGDELAYNYSITNTGTASLPMKWTERIYMQSPSGENRTLIKQSVYSSTEIISPGTFILQVGGVVIPSQLNIGDQGVLLVELIPDTSAHEPIDRKENNISIHQLQPWTVRKILTLELSASQITEGSNETIIAGLYRTGSLSTPLTVNISLAHPERFSFPATVVIPANQAGSAFAITAVDNDLTEGTIADVLQVSATSFQGTQSNLSVTDNDKPILSITNLAAQVTEGETISFQITTNLASTNPVQVFLTSGNPARFPVPAFVIIPAGSLSTTVSITLTQDNIPEVDLNVAINAGASNHEPASSGIEVKDDDLTGLELIIHTNLISESAGYYATKATLRRIANGSTAAFTANLATNLPNTLILPATISLAAGENEKTFDIGVSDNTLADGQRLATITASTFINSCGCNAPPASAGSVSAVITVSDNDGPALQLTVTQLTFPEGLSNAGFIRIARNTPVNEEQLINLTSSDPNEVTVPATALIPAGQAYIDVPISTINDGETDGSKQVYLQASFNGFSTGSTWIVVTDLNKPDLQIISASTGSDSVNSRNAFNYQLSVKNTGFATALTGVVVQAYLSSDNVIDNTDTLVAENIITVPIAAGQTVQVLNAATAPGLPGQHKLLFWVNPFSDITELLYTNNFSQPIPLTINPEYTASAQVNLPYFIKGTTIPITGSAVRNNGTPAANAQVEVYIITNGLRRSLTAVTDAAGNFATQFVPLANEAGHYITGATFPGTGATTEQDAFDIVGVRINGGQIPQLWVIVNDTLRGLLEIENLSNKSLANFSLVPVNLPGGAFVRFDTIPVLAGRATANLAYAVTGSVLSPGTNFEVANLEAKASEGVIQKADVFYYCQAPGAYVVADITKISIVASQNLAERIVEFRLINKGVGTTGNIKINLPQVNWLKNVTPGLLSSIKTGDTAVVVLKFLASAEIPFNYPVTGSIGVGIQNGNSFSIPFSFEKVSDTSGSVSISATNQFTYYTEGAPKVKDALVKVKDYFTGMVYAEGYTNASGIFIATGIPEGTHRVSVEKEKHLSYNGTITISPGDTVETTAFLNYQAVTFNWSVVPTAIQDQYDITLTTRFETNVPMPVVIIEVPKTMPLLAEGEVYAFNAVLTNHGLITAKDVAINLPANDPEYEFITNYVPADLSAQQSIQVPVLMRRRAAGQAVAAGLRTSPSVAAISQFLGMKEMQPAALSQAGLNCQDFVSVVYWYYCNTSTGLWQRGGVLFSFEGRVCVGGGGGGNVGGGGGGIGGGGVGGGTGSGGGSGNGGSGFPPCATCPGIEPVCFDCPGATVPPKYEAGKKGCDECINKILDFLGGQIEGAIQDQIDELLDDLLKKLIGKRLFFLWEAFKLGKCLGYEGVGFIAGVSSLGRLLDCIPSDLPIGFEDLEDLLDILETCLSTQSAGSGNTRLVAGSAAIASRQVLGAPYQEIASNFKTIVTAYRARERWAGEYFGNIIHNDGWRDLEPLLEPYVTKLDSIRPSAQALILAAVAGYDIQTNDLLAFFNRWNTSIHALGLNVLQPNGQFPGIINWLLVKAYSDSMVDCHTQAIDKGFQSLPDMYIKGYEDLKQLVSQQSQTVCASVSVQFSQQLAMTREAFEGTLEIFNGHPTDAMDSLSVSIQITDENGIPANGHFEIQTKSLTNLSDITGTGAITAQQKGAVKFLFMPELSAAPQQPKLYNFGGVVRYWDPFAEAIVTLPLASVPLTVNPGPNLMLHYFMERNILGDDPLTTPAVEPSVSAELAVMIENQGYGSAVNLTISASQPKVVDNEKGLAINFELVGSNLQGKPATLGVTNINFGTIPALHAKVGQWYFTSTLLGKFVSYQANVVHANSFGNPELSLVKGIKLHELTRSIRAYGDLEDGINDFLVNDIFDIDDRPDMLYFSQGNKTAKVSPAAAGNFSSPVLAPAFTNTLTVTASDTGWNYIKLDDPGNGFYELVSIVRSDGQVIPLNNAWLTFVTLPVSRTPVYENKFHFADKFASQAPVIYTVTWKPKNFNVPGVLRIDGAPQNVTATQVKKLTVVFDKAIDAATFTYADISLTFQGGANLITPSVIIIQADTSTFDVDITPVTTGNGSYTFTAQAAGVADIYGINGLTGKQISWSQFLTVPTVQAYQGIPPGRAATSFNTMQVLFNLPIDEASVTAGRFTIHKNGVVQPGAVVIDSVRADKKLFYLSGLDAILTGSGVFNLVVDLPNIKTITQVAGLQKDSVSLTIDNEGPLLLTFDKSNEGGVDPQHVTFVNIRFNEDVSGFNTAALQLTRNGEVVPLAITQLSNTDLQSWMAGNLGMLTYPEGAYTLTIDMAGFTDAIGNRSSGQQQLNWVVDRSAGVAITNLAVTPDLGFSNTDGITSGQTLNVAFNLSANASQVTISQVDAGGETVLLTIPAVPAGNVLRSVTLITAGSNTGIKVTATGSTAGIATAQQALFIDQVSLSAQWLFVAGQTLQTQVDTVQVQFSDKLLNPAAISTALVLTRNAAPVSTTGLHVEMLNDTLYQVSGLRQAGNIRGSYQLTIDLVSLNKYKSGKAGTGSVAVSWMFEPVNLAPVAMAGRDTIVTATGVFALDGSLSFDPEAQPVSYRWIAPAGVVLNDSTSATPFFTITNADAGKAYSFLLIVSDGSLFSTDVVNVSVVLTEPSISFTGLQSSYCSNSAPVQLTGTPAGGVFSGPGISGNIFTPSVAGAGIHLITYTKGAQSFSQNAIVSAAVIPSFEAITPICPGSTVPILPTISLNGITGTWNPATISNTTTLTYTFTPTAGLCATTTTLAVTVNNNTITWYRDADNDGYGNVAVTISTCSATAPQGYVNNALDCNDNNAGIHPGATEVCNGVDDNCNGVINEGCTIRTWYRDVDGDGYGKENNTKRAIIQPVGYALFDGDCNDNNPAIHPGVAEILNGIDDNCNGTADEGFPKRTWYRDVDGDGYGREKGAKISTVPIPGYVLAGDDCNDNNPAIHPGMTEILNGIDDNCNGTTDEGFPKRTWYRDADGDGYGRENGAKISTIPIAGYVLTGGDCNDNNPAIHPGAAELRNRKDDNCNGLVDEVIATMGAGGVTTHAKENPAAGRFDVLVSPVPSSHSFTVQLQGTDAKEKITLRVVDRVGRLVEVKGNLTVGQTIVIGGNYAKGFYIIEAVQGRRRKMIKIIKL